MFLQLNLHVSTPDSIDVVVERLRDRLHPAACEPRGFFDLRRRQKGNVGSIDRSGFDLTLHAGHHTSPSGMHTAIPIVAVGTLHVEGDETVVRAKLQPAKSSYIAAAALLIAWVAFCFWGFFADRAFFIVAVACSFPILIALYALSAWFPLMIVRRKVETAVRGD